MNPYFQKFLKEQEEKEKKEESHFSDQDDYDLQDRLADYETRMTEIAINQTWGE